MSDRISFEPHYKVDWAVFAPVDIKNIDIDNPTKEQLELLIPIRNRYSNSEIEFTSAVPFEIKKSSYCYFISPNGITELKLSHLEGTARFSMGDGVQDGPIGKIWSRIYYGNILTDSVSSLASNEGGFSLCAKTPLEFEQSSVELNESDVKLYYQSDRSLRDETKIDDPGFWKIISMFSFKILEQPQIFTFFQLAPDNLCLYGCCANRYFVALQDEYKVLSWNMYGCDI